MQISHSASTEISQESDIRKAKKRYWKNTKDTMRLQACRDDRSTRDARPYPYACVDTAQTCRSRFHGVSQREEYAHDIRATCKPKIEIRKESVLGERILRKYSRWK